MNLIQKPLLLCKSAKDSNEQQNGTFHKKHKKSGGRNMKEKGTKEQIEFNTVIFFFMQERQKHHIEWQYQRSVYQSNIYYSKATKRNKLIKLAN